MRSYHFAALSILAALLAVGCAPHGSAVPPVSNAPRTSNAFLVQRGQFPLNWLTETSPNPIYRFVVGPDDAMYALAGTPNEVIERIDVASGAIEVFTPPIDIGAIANGPGGLIWMCGSGSSIASMTTAGSFQTYDIGSQYGCRDIVEGPDGNLWITDLSANRIGRITPSGVATWRPITTGEVAAGLTSGLDGYVYVAENQSDDRSAIARIDTSLQSYQEFKTRAQGLNFLTTASDGSIYASSINGDLVRLGRNETITLIPMTAIGELSRNAPSTTIYIATSGTNGPAYETYGTDSHKFAVTDLPVQGSSPLYGVSPGPDHNVWNAYGDIYVYLNRVITPTPTTLSISVGATAGLSAGESTCNACDLKAISSNPSIAKVRIGSREDSWNVAGIAPGSTAISIGDHVGNSYLVPVLVNK